MLIKFLCHIRLPLLHSVLWVCLRPRSSVMLLDGDWLLVNGLSVVLDPLNMGQIDCLKTSVYYNQFAPCNIPEERRFNTVLSFVRLTCILALVKDVSVVLDPLIMGPIGCLKTSVYYY